VSPRWLPSRKNKSESEEHNPNVGPNYLHQQRIPVCEKGALMAPPKIWRPRLLIGTWVVATIALTGAGFVVASSRPDAVTYAPAEMPPPVPTLAAGDAAKAEAAMRTDPVFAQLPGARSAAVKGAFTALRGNESTGTTLRVDLPSPASFTGPWLFLRCRGSKQVEQKVTLGNVEELLVSVDAAGHVFQLAPAAPAADGQGPKPDSAEAAAGPPTVIRDLTRAGAVEVWRSKPGETLADAITQMTCADGFNDD
jgi:hypothetical protein